MSDDSTGRDRGGRGGGRVREIPIRDEEIRLGQFLKLADAVEQGSDVKLLLSAGRVRVNGEPEDRRGRQLSPGDVVEVRGSSSEQLVRLRVSR